MSLYYECHITIEPLFDEQLDQVKDLVARYKFKVAELLMKKRTEDTEERSQYDTFMTSHGQEYNELENRMLLMVHSLQEHNIKVWRYKIEDVVLDSKINDKLGLLL